MYRKEKLTALRKAMQIAGVDAYILNTADPHQSEYVSGYYQERAWFTGFTGSQGTGLVTADHALLWADGRYFIQAEKELAASEFKLMKLATPNYPTLIEWIKQNLKRGSTVAVNEDIYSQAAYEELKQDLHEVGVQVKAIPSLVVPFWSDRPNPSTAKIFPHEFRFTGKHAKDKIAAIRELYQRDGADATIIVGLDDVAWLYNFRGRDVPHNPVALAYALLTNDDAVLFIDEIKVDQDMRDFFHEQGISVAPYEAVGEALTQLDVQKLALEKKRISCKLYQALADNIEILDKVSYVTREKAKLNPTELANQKAAYKRDSAAVTRYLFWLKRNVEQGALTEYEVAEKLHEFRSQGENFLHESFGSISAYGANAAMMHYAAKQENCATLSPHSFYLIDSGGQYLDGTTDITRTVALGELTEEEKLDFTLTVKAMYGLATAVFLEGSTGHYLEVLARQPLWKYHLDYKCGTGHAVGYVLGVHEGPQRFAKTPSDVVLEEGMHITIEPGVYKEGKYGIRLENDYVVVFDDENMGDRFLRFDVMSYVPLDLTPLKIDLLSAEEIEWLNDYHTNCYEVLLPFMQSAEERADLAKACRALPSKT